MFIFQSPSNTKFDFNFVLFGIPIRVHPLFWLFTLLLGFSASNSISFMLIWLAVVFVSIIIHELGHSLAMRYYGQSSSIVLHSFGGLAIPDSVMWGGGRFSVGLTPNQHIFISFAGPLAGFLFAGTIMLIVVLFGGFIGTSVVFGFLPLPILAYLPTAGDFINIIIQVTLWVNVIWGVINLLPVYPLDGGQIARNIFIQFDPWDGVRKSLWLSVVVGGVVAFAGFASGNLFTAVLFGMMAFQSYQALTRQF